MALPTTPRLGSEVVDPHHDEHHIVSIVVQFLNRSVSERDNGGPCDKDKIYIDPMECGPQVSVKNIRHVAASGIHNQEAVYRLSHL